MTNLAETQTAPIYEMEYNFAQYIAYTLCPDVKAAGYEETAKDIRKAAVLIEKLVMELRHYRGANG